MDRELVNRDTSTRKLCIVGDINGSFISGGVRNFYSVSTGGVRNCA